MTQFIDRWHVTLGVSGLMVGLAMVVIMLYRPSGLWPAPRHGDTPSRAARAPGGGA